MENEKLNTLIEELEGSITDEELFDFLMVSLDEKPGGLVMDPSGSAVEKLEKVTEDAGLEYLKIEDDNRSFLDKILGREVPFSTTGFFFARERSDFRLLKDSEGDFYGCSNSAVGEFLGYPEKSVDHYRTTEKIGKETIREIKNNYPDMELKYLALVGYIPAPNREQVKNAVERGKKRAELLEEMGSKGLPRGKELKNELIAESHWE